MSVELRPEPEVRFLGILNEFPAVAVEGGVQIQLGDAFGEERRRVVFQLHVPSVAALGPRRIADVVLRYVSVGQEVAHHEVRIPFTVNLVSADEAAVTTPDAEVTEEVVILSGAQAGKRARELADRGEYEAAERTLREAVKELSATAEARRAARSSSSRPSSGRRARCRWRPRRTTCSSASGSSIASAPRARTAAAASPEGAVL